MKSGKNKYGDIQSNLIEECKRGNPKAQTEIYRLYYRAMFNTSLRITGKNDLAEDIMQESFLKAFRNLDQYSGEVTFGAWLKKIVINLSLDYLRKQRIKFEEIDDHENSLAEQEEEKINPEITIEDIRREIQKLPDGYRLVLSLYLLEGYDHDEIAEILGISASTSRSQFSRAKKKLSENLKMK